MSHNSDEKFKTPANAVLFEIPADFPSPFSRNLPEKNSALSGELNKRPISILPAVAGQQEFLEKMLTGSQSKTAYAIRVNAENMICGIALKELVEFSYGDGKKIKAWISKNPENLNCTAFLTLTVGEFWEDGRFHGVADADEASRRFNNLNRKVLKLLFEKAIVVTERHQSGKIHFHILGILRGRPDIRTGFNFDALEALKKTGTRFSAADVGATPELAAFWKMLRETLPKYGFGRAELTPIRKTGEAVACYISKYIEKNVCNRLPQDARKKLVRYIGWEKSQLKPNDFSWNSQRATAWRAKTRICASLLGITEREQCSEILGPRWAWRISEIWKKIDDAPHPFIVWDFPMKETVRQELFLHSHQDAVRQLFKSYPQRRKILRKKHLLELIKKIADKNTVTVCGVRWSLAEWDEYQQFWKN